MTYSKSIRKRFWAISVFTLILTLVSTLVTFYYITPKYEAKVQILVNEPINRDGVASVGDIGNQLKLVKTYSDMIESPRIMGPAAEKAPDGKGMEELRDSVRIETNNDSQVMTIIVRDNKASEAVVTANAIAETFDSEVLKIMAVDNVQIVSKAHADSKPVEPRPYLYIGLTFIFSLALSTGIVFLREIWQQEPKENKVVKKSSKN